MSGMEVVGFGFLFGVGATLGAMLIWFVVLLAGRAAYLILRALYRMVWNALPEFALWKWRSQ